jgi:hypothetical protein
VFCGDKEINIRYLINPASGRIKIIENMVGGQEEK